MYFERDLLFKRTRFKRYIMLHSAVQSSDNVYYPIGDRPSDGIRKDPPDLLCEIGVGMYRYIDVLPAVVAGEVA